MSIRALPPVWRPVPAISGTAREGREALSRHFGGENVELFGSGTQALTVAIREAIGRRDPASCNVILPAYGCPDLVTACVGAGAQPRLVDVSDRFVGYDLGGLRSSIDAHTVAIVAVDLLGAGDQAEQIAPVARETGVALIQDWAQSLPRVPTAKTGNHLVLSFGRGKPLNLLGGGAVIGEVTERYPQGEGHGPGTRWGAVAATAFTLLSHPAAYGVVEKLAGSRIGSTVYKSPVPPRRVSDDAPSRLPGGLDEYRREASCRVTPYLRYFSEWQDTGITPLSDRFRDARCEPLRLPLLARNQAHRDRMVSRLRARGLGASAMYGASLPETSAIPQTVAVQGPFSNAQSLAGRLLTVPTHGRVDDSLVSAIHECMREVDGD